MGARREVSTGRSGVAAYHGALRGLVMALALAAGAGLILMIMVTGADVVLRIFGRSFAGSYDLVRLIGAVTLACALPYTTAIKGHVAIEFLHHKLGRRGRGAVDALVHGAIAVLFALIGWASVSYGHSLRAKGEVSATLQVPVFWIPYVIAFASLLVILVSLYHVFHPGKEMIKP